MPRHKEDPDPGSLLAPPLVPNEMSDELSAYLHARNRGIIGDRRKIQRPCAIPGEFERKPRSFLRRLRRRWQLSALGITCPQDEWR